MIDSEIEHYIEQMGHELELQDEPEHDREPQEEPEEEDF